MAAGSGLPELLACRCTNPLAYREPLHVVCFWRRHLAAQFSTAKRPKLPTVDCSRDHRLLAHQQVSLPCFLPVSRPLAGRARPSKRRSCRRAGWLANARNQIAELRRCSMQHTSSFSRTNTPTRLITSHCSVSGGALAREGQPEAAETSPRAPTEMMVWPSGARPPTGGAAPAEPSGPTVRFGSSRARDEHAHRSLCAHLQPARLGIGRASRVPLSSGLPGYVTRQLELDK